MQGRLLIIATTLRTLSVLFLGFPPPLVIEGGLGAEGAEKILRLFFGRKPDFPDPWVFSPPCYRGGSRWGRGKNPTNMVDSRDSFIKSRQPRDGNAGIGGFRSCFK